METPALHTTSVTCNHCGAAFDVQPSTRFVTCGYCGAKLEVHRTGAAAYTQVLGEIQDSTRRAADSLETIKLQNELEQIDREWDARANLLLVRDKHGHTSVPTATGGVVGAVIPAVFGCVWMAGALAIGAPAVVLLFGLVFVGVGVAGGFSTVAKAAEYERAKAEHDARRSDLLRQIRERETVPSGT